MPSSRLVPSRTLLHALAFVLALAAAGCSREVEVTVVVDSTPFLDKASLDASPTSTADMGKRFTVKVPKFGTHAFWAVKDTKSFVKTADVSPYPVTGSPNFVTTAKLPVKGPKGDVLKELPLGAPVSTIAPPAMAEKKMLAVVENGAVIGFCDVAGVSAQKPPPAVFSGSVKELLRQGDIESATRFLEGGLAAYPDEPSLKPWVELVRRATTDPLSFTPPGQRTTVAPEPAAKKGANAWVAPLAAAVFEAAKADGRIVTVVRQNTQVKVLDVTGAFAKVELAATDAVTWAPAEGELSKLPDKLPEKYRAPAAEEAAAPAPAPALFMRLADLQGAASTAEKLVARGKSALAANKADEGIELLSRAVGLGDPDSGAFEPLFDAAVAAGDRERAVWALAIVKLHAPILHALRGANGWSSAKIADVALVRGCRAPLLAGGGLESTEMLSKLARPKPGQCLVVSGSQQACEDCQADADSAEQKLQKETAANEKFLSTADELYPLGPYLRITVVNTGAVAGPPREPLFVTLGNKTYWVPILALGAYERVTLYLSVANDREVYAVSVGDESPGEMGEDASTELTVENPQGSTVWVGQSDGDCQACERNEADGTDSFRERGDDSEDEGD
jgi:hypothetical protein